MRIRLSAPTFKTFSIAGVLLLAGITSYLGLLGDLLSDPVTYWATAGGGVLLAIGAVFNRL
jgi:hypothetical protein